MLPFIALHRAAPLDLGQAQIHQPLEELWVTPEGVEGAVKHRLVLVAVDQYRAQGCVHAGTFIHAAILERLEGNHDAIRPDGQPRSAQHAGEVDDVFSEAAGHS